MRVYFANIGHYLFPERGADVLAAAGISIAGNWIDGTSVSAIGDYDALLFNPVSPHVEEPVRDIVPTAALDAVPAVAWILFPDEVTGVEMTGIHGWAHRDSIAPALADALRRCRFRLANSDYTRRLLEARGEFAFDVCPLGIDLEGIAAAGETPGGPVRVLWNHRWTVDKNVVRALTIIAELSAAYPSAEFRIGRQEQWIPPWYAPAELRAACAPLLDTLRRRGNVVFSGRHDRAADYWAMLARADIAFSCSHHETFGVGMLEAAAAGAACVVPDRAAYPSVHTGALVVPEREIAATVARLIDDTELRARVAAAGRRVAAGHDVAATAGILASYLFRAAT